MLCDRNNQYMISHFNRSFTYRWLRRVDAYGNIVHITTLPRSGLNLELRRVAETYGVIKYNRAGRDDPHWSDNGA
jgi:hypothetical protein